MRRWGIVLTIILLIIFTRTVVANECDQSVVPKERLDFCIQDIKQRVEKIKNEIKPLETELAKSREQLKNIQTGLEQAKADLKTLELSIAEREKEFGQNYVLLAEGAVSYYKILRYGSSSLNLFANGLIGGVMRDLFYRQAVTDWYKDVIEKISGELLALDADKKKAQEDKAKLDELQAKVDKEAKFF